DGGHTVQVKATDTAGNSALSNVLSFTLDTVEAAPTVALTSDTGSSGSDGITSDAHVTVTGQDGDATLTYSVDGGAFAASYDPDALSDGGHAVQVKATDTAGNSALSNVLSFTLDTVEAAPTVALTSDTGSSGSGGLTSGAHVTVTGQDGDATLTYSVDGGAFAESYDPDALSDGGHTVQVKATDTAGNSALSNVLTFTLEPVERVPSVSL